VDLKNTLVQVNTLSTEIENALVYTSGEITPEIESLLAIKASNEVELKAQVDQIALTYERLDSLYFHYVELAKEYAKLAKGLEEAQMRLKAQTLQHLQSMHLTLLSGSIKAIGVRNNPPKVDIYNESILPEAYIKATLVEKVDRDAIKEDLKQGLDVPGARLIQGQSLTIKGLKKGGE
jgi:hypothetical protein